MYFRLIADITVLADEYVTFEVFHKEAKLQGGEAAIAGALASLIAQFITTPVSYMDEFVIVIYCFCL